MLGLFATRFILRRRLHQATGILAHILRAHGCGNEPLVIRLRYRQTLSPLDPDPVAIILDRQHRALDFDIATRLALGRAIESYMTRERVPRLAVMTALRSIRIDSISTSPVPIRLRANGSTQRLRRNLLEALAGQPMDRCARVPSNPNETPFHPGR